ncbi:hypothetical protein [Gulosibacter sp. 10]|uniref:hypothetical protein n=1 Tax=Gulosibacter sp. 10 TaxID=1255570 RepID=UPI00111E758B|nr:hypothetical protein [Gulosibacter sp. 10]
MRYEVVTGLVVEADSKDEAVELATQYEEAVHDSAVDVERIGLSARIWGGGTVDVEAADDADDAEDLIDEWIDELEDLDDLELDSDEDFDEEPDDDER